jgi:hypothetical protein
VITETWETRRLNWDVPGVDGEVIEPRRVLALALAQSSEEATRRYQSLDGSVSRGGQIYGAALPIVKTILALIPSCSPAGKVGCLNLLCDICAASAESAPGSPGVWEACLEEVRHFAWYLIHGLQFEPIENAPLYLDLIASLGYQFPDFRATAISYLELALTRDLPPREVPGTKSTILDLMQRLEDKAQ